MAVINLTWDEIDRLVDGLAGRLPPNSCCWGIPRGGSVVAALLRSGHGVNITADWTEATIAVDDIIDSGRTAIEVREKHGLRTEALIVKETTDWVVFPWEGTELSEDAQHTVTRFLQQIGENPNRAELERMPRRVVNFWEKLFSGYQCSDDDIAYLLRGGDSLQEGSIFDDEMIVLPEIPYVSSCENHLLPFFGVARIGYLPRERQSCLGDVPKLVDVLSRRLQVQDRLTHQICNFLEGTTEGAAVLLRGNYLCPMVQGRGDRRSTWESTAFSGRFRDGANLRERFLTLSRQAP